MTYSKIFTGFLFFLSLIQINSCGIYSFSGTSITDNVKTIYVHYIKNSASLIQPNLSNTITEELKTKCLNETNLAWNENDADLNFSGTIKDYTLAPMAIQSNNETAAQNRLTISVEIIYTNKLDNSQNFSKIFTHYADFDSNKNFSEEEEELNAIIINNLIDDIFNASLINW